MDACVGVLILFAGLRRPNSIKDWLVRSGDRYKVDVNVQDYDILNGPEQDLVNDIVARKVLQSIEQALSSDLHDTTLFDIRLPSNTTLSRCYRDGQIWSEMPRRRRFGVSQV